MAASVRGWRLTSAGLVLVLMAAAILAASLIHRVNLLLLVFSLMLSLLTMGLLIGRRQLRRISVKLFAPAMVSAGRPIPLEVEVNNARRGDAWGLRVDLSATSDSFAVSATIPIHAIASRKTIRSRVLMTFPRRGLYQFRPPRLSSFYPFGFIRWWRTETHDLEMPTTIVHPPLGTLTSQAVQQLGMSHLQDARSSPGLVDGVDEFRGVREFRQGDSPRLIHWRSTARLGQFVVRELDPPASGGALLLVDLRGADHADQENVENVLSFTSSLLSHACRRSSIPLVLTVLGLKPIVVRGQMNSHSLEGFLRALALAQPSRSSDAITTARQLLRASDTRERSIWAVGLSMIPFVDIRSLVGHRLSPQRILLNLSAEHLEHLWIPPNLNDFSSSTRQAHKNDMA